MRVIAKLVVKGHLVTAGNLIGEKKKSRPSASASTFFSRNFIARISDIASNSLKSVIARGFI